jgi:hypothetical protein
MRPGRRRRLPFSTIIRSPICPLLWPGSGPLGSPSW